MFAHRLSAASDECGLLRRTDYAQQAALMRLFAEIDTTSATLDPKVYASSPQALARATGDGEGLGLLERRRLRAQARSLWRAPLEPKAKLAEEDLHAALDACRR